MYHGHVDELADTNAGPIGPMIIIRRGMARPDGSPKDVELHTPHWHGNTVVMNDMRTDVISLLPMGMLVADMQPDAAGTWFFHCHVNDHIPAGMLARYRVEP